ncbi:MAG: DUF4912 domain-containing protein [Gammaproteobacteria bacterium]|jgi:hypothetical protein
MKEYASHSSGKGTGRHHATPRLTGAAALASEPFSAAELRRISKQISAQWFRPVESGRLTLLEIDPWRVHAYWNVPEDEIAAVRSRLPHNFEGGGGEPALVLRFTDLSPDTSEAAHHPHFDIEVEGASNNWYIDLWRDAKHYSAELGLKAADGTFIALVRSNEVVIPRGGPSPELEYRNLEVRTPRPVETREAAATGATTHSDALLKDLYPKRLPLEDGYPLAVAEASGEPLEEPDFPELGGGPEEEVDEPLSALEAPVMDDVRSAKAPAADGSGFPVIDMAEIAQYHSLARKTKARLSSDLARHLPPVDLEAVSPSDVELVPQPLPVWVNAVPEVEPDTASANTEDIMAPADIVSTGMASEGASGGDSTAGDLHGCDLAPKPEPPVPPGTTSAGYMPYALEGLLADTVFSHNHGSSPLDGVYLLIQGKIEPDRPLTLFGERVETQVDGSFRVQLPLQRGPELTELLYRLRERYGDRNDG